MSKTRNTIAERKRQELTSLVKQTLGVKNRLKFKDLEWDTELFNGRSSCGYLILRGDGNVMSLYTLNQRRGRTGFEDFQTVEISLLQAHYEKLAGKIEEELSKNGYVPKVTSHYSRTLVRKSLSKSK